MKLAEALVLRADLQKRIEQLRARLRQSALVQEGEQPPEDPYELLAEAARLVDELAGLIMRINRTNLATTLPNGTTLTEAIARRDALQQRYSLIETAAETASNRIDRYGRSEIRKVATVDVGALRKQTERLAQERRELDTAIQATNWASDLIE
ncbi:MAG TPA: DIP1984 family protein [Ktedonobacterales bacterium]